LIRGTGLERERHAPWFVTHLDTVMDTAAPAIRPVRVDVPQQAIHALRQRLAMPQSRSTG
jgi:hypothetical protein